MIKAPLRRLAVAVLGSAPLLSVSPAASAPTLQKPASGAPLWQSMGDGVRKELAAAEQALDARDYDAAADALARAERLSHSHGPDDEREQFYIAVLRYELAMNAAPSEEQISAIDVLLHNPLTSAKWLPDLNRTRGLLAVDAERYAEAIPFLLKARALGDPERPDIAGALAKAYRETGDVAASQAEEARYGALLAAAHPSD